MATDPLERQIDQLLAGDQAAGLDIAWVGMRGHGRPPLRARGRLHAQHTHTTG